MGTLLSWNLQSNKKDKQSAAKHINMSMQIEKKKKRCQPGDPIVMENKEGALPKWLGKEAGERGPEDASLK